MNRAAGKDKRLSMLDKFFSLEAEESTKQQQKQEEEEEEEDEEEGEDGETSDGGDNEDGDGGDDDDDDDDEQPTQEDMDFIDDTDADSQGVHTNEMDSIMKSIKAGRKQRHTAGAATATDADVSPSRAAKLNR